MLNKSERFKILNFWKHFCVLGQFPIQVDLKNWRLKGPTTKRKCISIVAYSIYVLHILFKTSSLVYTYLFVPDVQLHQLIIHTVMATVSVMCAFWYYKAYFQDHRLFAAYVEMTLVGNIGGTPDWKDGLKRHWTRRLREYSMQDLIAMSSPYISLSSISIVSAIYVYDPSMRLLLYSALPTYLQNWATFGLLLVEEVRLLMINVSVVAPIFQVHVTSFDLVGNRLLALTKKIENGNATPRSVYKILCSLQLYVSIFNNVNRYLIFTWKLVSISLCIECGFAAIAHCREYPVFGLMYYALLMDVALLYIFIYEKAFKIPQLFEKATARTLLHMCGGPGDGLRKPISSIRPPAVTVGHFHRMERLSTLIFSNFVVTNIVSMLVAFR